MKKLIIILILIFSGVVEAQPLAVHPYYTNYIRHLMDDPNATHARNTLELGITHDPNFLSINILGDHINIATKKTPASGSDTGTAGNIAWDSDYLYVCITTDTWKRVELTSWPLSSEQVVYAGEDIVYAGEDVVYP
jgi:hypothetical protein